MRRFLAISFLAILTVGLDGQTVKVGVIGGVPLNDQVRYGVDHSKPYVVGPTVEVKWFGGKVGVEFSALYRRTGTGASYLSQPVPEYPQIPLYYNSVTRGNTWEFPLIGKYYFRNGDARLRPFLGTGYTIRNTWMTVKEERIYSTSTVPERTERNRSSGIDIGATVVGGMEWKAFGRVWLQPQFRYTRYGDRTDTLNRQQTDFMLGIRF